MKILLFIGTAVGGWLLLRTIINPPPAVPVPPPNQEIPPSRVGRDNGVGATFGIRIIET